MPWIFNIIIYESTHTKIHSLVFMALSQCHVLTKSSHKLLPLSYNLIAKCISRNTPDKSLTIEADAFDDFTTQLVQRHISKWESIQARKKQTVAPKLDTICSPPSSCHLKNDDLCTKLLAVVENSDFRNVNAIIKTCAEVEYCPDTKLTMDILSLCGQSGNHTAILDLKHLYQKYNSQFLQENANFDVYLAEALWVAGRIIKALNLFDDLYRNNTSLRRHARSIIKNLILNARVNPSEAESLNIIKFCERVYTEHNDLYLLATMCQMCFLSEWYCDQKTSIELLDKNSELLKLMLNRFPYLISVALANHQTDIVYILLEFLLKKKLRAEYSNVLKCLFTYKVRQGDLRSCREIIKWSEENSVSLSFYKEEFLKLLLKQPTFKTDQHNVIKKCSSKYKLKF